MNVSYGAMVDLRRFVTETKDLTVKSFIDTLRDFRDKHGLTDRETLDIANGRGNMGETLKTVSSKSNPAKSYRIIRGADGVVYCECMGWKMNKDCKHLREFLGSCSTSTPSPTAPKGTTKRAVKKTVTASEPELTIAVDQAVKELTGRV